MPMLTGATQRLAAQPDRLGHRTLHAGRHRGRLDLVGGSGEGHDELVAPESRHHVVRPHRRTDALRDRDDEVVAGVVAEEVVGGLEPVHVDEQERAGSRRRGGEDGVQVRQERAPVGQARQLVVVGDVAQLVLGLEPGLHLGEQGGDGAQRPDLVGAPSRCGSARRCASPSR
jgi:hypothetical protein